MMIAEEVEDYQQHTRLITWASHSNDVSINRSLLCWLHDLLLWVVPWPLMPIHLSCVMGWSITPSTGTPLRKSAIKVPKTGLPAAHYHQFIR